MARKVENGEYKQLLVHLHPEVIKAVKTSAIERGMKIREWVAQAFIEKILRQNKYK